MKWQDEYGFTQEEWDACIKVLEILKDQPFQNPNNQQFKTLVTKIHKQARKSATVKTSEPTAMDQMRMLVAQTHRTAKKIQRKTIEQEKRIQTIHTLKQSNISQNALNNETLYDDVQQSDQTYQKVPNALSCYCCAQSYQLVHHFYHRLCPKCAEHNYQQRFDQEDLTDKNIVITGARVKVGYATCLKLLRLGANVIATTRFPAVALAQFAQEKDYQNWQDKLVVYGLDLRNLHAVENFVQFVKNHFKWCDVLINNAAQTIQYPSHYYTPIIQLEQKLLKQHSATIQQKCFPNTTSITEDGNALTYHMAESTFALNRFNQPIDTRMKNSWNSKLEEISIFELLEVNFINHISPYILIKSLKENFSASPSQYTYIINVTSSEGQFSYQNKTMFHPHTNMTKAALNMLTRTSAVQLIDNNIVMNSVDVGWISTGAHEKLRTKQFEEAIIPPLDSVDGAARIIHPILLGIRGKISYGKLFKNYQVTDW